MFRIFGREIEAGTPSYQELLQYYHPDDRIYHVQVVEIAIATGKPYDLEGRLYGPDGSWVYVQARGETVLDKSGKVVQLVGTILDITERKLSEQKLLKLSDRLTLALKSGAIGTWDWDIISEGNIIWDDRMYEIYGLPNQRGAIFYEDWRNCLHPDDLEKTECALQNALAGTGTFDVEFRILHQGEKCATLTLISVT